MRWAFTEAQVNTLLTSTVGSVYLGDFIDRERVKNVYMQADAPYRT